MTRRSTMMIGPVLLLLAACLSTAEAAGLAGESGSSRTRSSSNSSTYQAPVDRSPEVLCGCTEVLKNFA